MNTWSWPESYLKGRSQIGLQTCGQQRNLPLLILDGPRETETQFREDVRIHPEVILGAALGKILAVDFSVPELKTDFLSRTQPVVRPDQFALCRASHPSPDQPTVIGVSAEVLTVGIKTRSAKTTSCRAGISALKPQIEFVYSRRLGEIQSALPD